jgi:hypothetical protein
MIFEKVDQLDIDKLKIRSRLHPQLPKHFFKKFSLFFVFLNFITLHPGGIRSHDPLLQSPRWQVETIPRRQGINVYIYFPQILNNNVCEVTCSRTAIFIYLTHNVDNGGNRSHDLLVLMQGRLPSRQGFTLALHKDFGRPFGI